MLNKNPTVEEIVKRLRAIRYALDDSLGDTDPSVNEDATDDEIRQEEPVFWACIEISRLMEDLDEF